MRRIYSDLILQEVPRLLSLMDRNPDSDTYGCCDRNFWHYGTKWWTDFRFQELCLTLALVYSNKYPNNLFFGREKIKEWAIAAMRFWAENQNKDGSFSEWWVSERSFPATCFSTAAVQNASFLLDVQDERILGAIEAAEKWIKRHDEKLVANQEAGAIYVLGEPFNQERLNDFLATQDKEGWWPEYGGGDVGYGTVALSFLARLWKVSEDERLLCALHKLIIWLAKQKVVGSRGTRFILPDGLEIMAPYNEDARRLADANLNYLKNCHALSYDDKYLASFSSHYPLAYDNFYPRKVQRVESLIIKDRVFSAERISLGSPAKTLALIPAQVLISKSDFLSQKAKSFLRKKMILKKKGGRYTPSRNFFMVDDLE